MTPTKGVSILIRLLCYFVMNYIGKPLYAHGAFIFSLEKHAHDLQELALVSLVTMTTGQTYVHVSSNILLETQELTIPHLWFEHMLYTTNPPEEHLLVADGLGVQESITIAKKINQQLYPLVSVAYDDRMKNFYGTFHPEWVALPCSENNINGYVLKYRKARTKMDGIANAELLFSEPSQAYQINTNELLQIAIGMALALKDTTVNYELDLQATEFKCDVHHKRHDDKDEGISLLCATR